MVVRKYLLILFRAIIKLQNELDILLIFEIYILYRFYLGITYLEKNTSK